jgi:hypothetical protein
MKKLILILVAALGFVSSSEAQFFEKVNYIGALESSSVKDWTKTWTQWDPKNAPYGTVSDTNTLSSPLGEVNITATLTLDPAKVYLLRSLVVVRNGGKLIIPAGTVIRGQANSQSSPRQYATIIIERGGYIQIDGTVTNPVVMTSAKPIGSRDRGDWGGLVLCGKAVNNQGPDIQMEGFNNVSFDNMLAKHGGINDDDNSGSINNLRIEFGGLAFEPNKEINGLTFCSIGRNTAVNNVQVSFSGDDSYEWFGGTVNCKHIIAFKGTDDDFDTDFGYRGAVQFGISFRDSSYYDMSWNAASGASTSETFESDNDASGSGKLPLTSAVFSNMTCVGPVPAGMTWSQLSTAQKGGFRRGVRIRRNSRLSIVNSIFMGYRNFLMFDGDSVLVNSGVKSNKVSDKNDLFRNNYIYGVKASAPVGATNTGLAEISSGGNVNALDSWVRNPINSNTIDTSKFIPGFLVNTNNFTAPDFRPMDLSKQPNFEYGVLGFYGVTQVKVAGKVKSVSAYPNPTNGEYTVEFTSTQGFTADVFVTDLNGRMVKRISTMDVISGNNFVNVNLSDLNNGLYFFHIQGGNNNIVYQVIVTK